MPGQWAALVQSGKDLEKAFDDAVSHFNNQNAVALKNALSPNVVLKNGQRITPSFIRTAHQNTLTRSLDPSTASPNGTRRNRRDLKKIKSDTFFCSIKHPPVCGR
jgi:hypothetical protein